MKIGIDMDDTLNCLAPALFEAGRKYNKKHNIQYEIKENEWLFEECFGWNDNNINEFIKKHLKKVLMNADVQPDAAEVIKKLKENGNEIIIITARGSNHDWNPQRFCKSWLDKHGIIYDKLIVKCSNKGKICEEEKIDIFIDDNIEYCETVKNKETRVFLFDSVYNQNNIKFERVYNWKEIYEKIINIKKQEV